MADYSSFPLGSIVRSPEPCMTRKRHTALTYTQCEISNEDLYHEQVSCIKPENNTWLSEGLTEHRRDFSPNPGSNFRECTERILSGEIYPASGNRYYEANNDQTIPLNDENFSISDQRSHDVRQPRISKADPYRECRVASIHGESLSARSPSNDTDFVAGELSSPVDSLSGLDVSTLTLDKIRAINAKSLKLAQNTHVKQIWDRIPAALSSKSEAQDKLRIADIEKAKSTMKQLNPGIKNSDVLMQGLMDHLQGKQISLTPEMFESSSRETYLMPILPNENSNNGLEVSHMFTMKSKDVENCPPREFEVIKVILSPEVLAVNKLLGVLECNDLITIAQPFFSTAPRPKLCTVKVRANEQITELHVPDVSGSTHTELRFLGF